ncbi:DET1- and DDB1-associated protein 1 isoform X3 [Zea mays]|uniref:DET1- and DDB1-associated protein 1 isoform X3 n=1 Tax=Zea mays TaxID=4577 RepID=UPI0009AA3E5D|nr:uncharacterized protein LOC103631233 isoform X3 [Zea mays]|eukprot:XP_020395252.1 uncharacterized LOC103631233 isoform X2 [Zea mays]
MGSPLGGWPSYNPHNFSQLVPADPSAQPSNVTPATYVATHRTDPPPNQGRVICEQLDNSKHLNGYFSHRLLVRLLRTESRPGIAVITTEARNILLRHLYQKSEEKLRPKRAAADNLAPENNNKKQPRGPVGDVGGQSSARS